MGAKPAQDRAKGAPMVIRLPDWPEADRQLWEAGQWLNAKPRHPGLGTRLRPTSIRNAMRGYGRFLAVLRDAGDLRPGGVAQAPSAGKPMEGYGGETPAQRVTPPRVARFVAALRQEGNEDNTIKARLFELRVAIRIMQPKAQLSWLTRPGGHSLDSLLPQEPKDLPVIPSSVLYQWGLELMDESMAGLGAAGGVAQARSAARPMEGDGGGGAVAQAADRKGWTEETRQLRRDRRFRDGLIIAILACRAPRLRSLAGIRIGRQFQQIGEEFWLCFAKADIKNRKAIEYSLPEGLTPYIHKYLGEVRPRMLGALRTDWLWVIEQDAPFQDIGIAQMIERRSLARFGHAFGPHRFRHALATALADHDPKNPGLAATLLGVTETVVAEHYRKAKQGRAARLLQKDLAEERERTRLLAERELNPKLPEPAE